MAKLRKLVYAYEDYDVNPKDYDNLPDERIRQIEEEHISLKRKDVHVKVDLREKEPKQFTLDQLKQLVATRGFLNVICQWLEPDQVQDEELRGYVALTQHLLTKAWNKLEVK